MQVDQSRIESYLADIVAEVNDRAKESGVVEESLIDRLQDFARFRNMLVHRYWQIEDRLFLENIRAGTRDFHAFVKNIKEAYTKEDNVEKSTNS